MSKADTAVMLKICDKKMRNLLIVASYRPTISCELCGRSTTGSATSKAIPVGIVNRRIMIGLVALPLAIFPEVRSIAAGTRRIHGKVCVKRCSWVVAIVPKIIVSNIDIGIDVGTERSVC
jgi:hypothetical protein